MEINEAARKHGVSDEDILHANENPVATGFDSDTGGTQIVGTDTSGGLVELVVIDGNHIIHAMRPPRQTFLQRVGLSD